MERIRAVVRSTDPMLPITALRPLHSRIIEALSEDRVLALLSQFAALLATMLAATGVLATVGQLVADRTREFGIQAALGAPRGTLIFCAVRGMLAASGIGLALGLGLYWAVSRWLAARLYGLGALDLHVLLTVTLTLVAVTVVSALAPAYRVTKIDPVVALRTE